MVVVGVGYDDQIRGELVDPGQGDSAFDVANPPAEQRVREDPGAIELDEQSGVSDVGDGSGDTERLSSPSRGSSV